MESEALTPIVPVIEAADERGDPASIFMALAEGEIWPVARILLDHPDYGFGHGLVLLQAIDSAFLQLADRASVATTILHVLGSTVESLLYNAAVCIVLHYAPEWDESIARQMYTVCEERYLNTMVDGDLFIATQSLEGAVMLPLLRDDGRMLFKAIGLLLTDFPSIPLDSHDPAYLPVKALKLLGRCYDRRPEQEIANHIRQMIGHSNRATATEARFNLGIVRLYDSFRADDEASFQAALLEAQQLFETAAREAENRSDAELFALLTSCFLTFATTSQPADITDLVHTATEIFNERLMAFGGAVTGTQAATERALIRLIRIFERWSLEIEFFHQQPDMSVAMRELARLYAALRDAEQESNLAVAAEQNAESRVLLPLLRGRFVQVQEITTRLQRILDDPTWSASLSSVERAFYELVLEEVRTVPVPKPAAATGLDAILVVAEREAPLLAQRIVRMQARNLHKDEMLIELASQMLDDHRALARQLVPASGAAQDILTDLLPALQAKLNWDADTQAWTYLASALKMCVRYLITLVHLTWEEAKPVRVDFLYAKEEDGMGQDASEIHLEAHFYEVMKFAEVLFPEWEGTLIRQLSSHLPGRGDLAFLFPDRVLFGLEVKCEKTDPSPDTIRRKFLAQAQSYAAGTHGVSIAFILDTSPKVIGVPLRDAKDYCYIDQCSVPNAVHPNYVVVFIFPANRYHPSTHTKGLRKVASTPSQPNTKRTRRKQSS